MDNLKSQFHYYAMVDGQSKLVSADVELEDYKRAADTGISFKNYINTKFSNADKSFGCAFDQGVQAIGAGNRVHGGITDMSQTIAQLNSGQLAGPGSMNAAITAPDGTDTSAAGRIFMPEIVLDIMRSSLNSDNSDIEQGFNSLIAITENISGSIYQQPIITVTANEAIRSQSVAQGADPTTMVSITAANTTKSITTKSIGLEISDQAARFATIDLVATAIAAQARGERAMMVDADINAVINGDSDSGITPLVAKKLKDYDPANILAAGDVTQLAFLKLLHDQYQKRRIDSAIMSIDTYYKFEQRTNRPTVTQNASTDGRLDVKISPMNFSLDNLNILILDAAVIGANQALFLDSRYALHKVVDVTAQYQAVQQFVMRRISMMRFDYGQHVTRLQDDASQLITLAVV